MGKVALDYNTGGLPFGSGAVGEGAGSRGLAGGGVGVLYYEPTSIDARGPLLLQWLSAFLFGGPIEITLVDFALFE